MAVLLLCLVSITQASGQTLPGTTWLENPAALAKSLQAGGFNLYFRHAQTDWSQSDNVQSRGDWTSCDPARIRQLSEAGRETSRHIGEAMRALSMPVVEVIASPYCRTMETARLMALGEVKPSTEVMNLRVADYFGGTAAIVATAQRLLGKPVAPGSNRVIVAHGNVARQSTPVYPGEAEAVVFRPLGNSRFELIARITPAQWALLLAATGQRQD